MTFQVRQHFACHHLRILRRKLGNTLCTFGNASCQQQLNAHRKTMVHYSPSHQKHCQKPEPKRHLLNISPLSSPLLSSPLFSSTLHFPLVKLAAKESHCCSPASPTCVYTRSERERTRET
uniref:Uncharacterized protein n=1 Tax=Physcomitrium patens TaxID=3218 RepID=A0A2K1KGB3_PHYPA|nr:hypothetical protein PHYPA_009205 [Physcomitrium patens]